MKQSLTQQKAQALKEYTAARIAYINDMSKENLIAFCNKKRICMLLGVRI